ncbi:MAG TPA: type II toxin-antitoxin system VapC family toxin [Phenylobacterium sp.]|uniref:type II toxin-antitoxin system VapC family toxin n=1 Tax=Phenylobacterium sp. TaxID=1871053 RepID=UPI002B48C9D7|nr:type II toxin-antitoxin system VapC family toxin [Phenylobacterium sp.]HKR88040.1 type II toxin-antitoxin system VapC family toxin [Phenylobacterium sp.]
MRAYLDASALLPMLIAEPGSAVVDAFVEAAADELVVSEFAAAEVASAISRLVRTDRLAADDAAARLADFDAWRAAATEDVELNAADVRLAHLYVRRFELMLRAPDALHAAICRRADLELITLDRRLATAAEALGVSTRLLGP